MVPRRSGKVINIASIQGLTGTYPENMPTLAYNASKGAVINLTRTPRRRVGAARHQRQRDRARLLPDQDDGADRQGDRQGQDGGDGADEPRRRARGPEGA
jgi:hypothetical protein